MHCKVSLEILSTMCYTRTDSYLADTAKLVLEHAKNLHAYQIAHDFKVRKMVREAFFERARISTKPTKNGQREIGKL